MSLLSALECMAHHDARKGVDFTDMPPKAVRLTAMLVILVTTSSTATPAWSYCEEVHYALTYYLARLTGFTPSQSHRLASACQNVDDSPHTGPVQAGNVINPVSSAQPARTNFHAFMNQQLYVHCLEDTPLGELQRKCTTT